MFLVHGFLFEVTYTLTPYIYLQEKYIYIYIIIYYGSEKDDSLHEFG